jgi:hypothetical protein
MIRQSQRTRLGRSRQATGVAEVDQGAVEVEEVEEAGDSEEEEEEAVEEDSKTFYLRRTYDIGD